MHQSTEDSSVAYCSNAWRKARKYWDTSIHFNS